MDGMWWAWKNKMGSLWLERLCGKQKQQDLNRVYLIRKNEVVTQIQIPPRLHSFTIMGRNAATTILKDGRDRKTMKSGKN